MTKLPIVGVMGSGQFPHEDKAAPLGTLLAGMGVHLLTGGGRGVMTSVTQAFTEVKDRKGNTIGILPCLFENGKPAPKDGYPNPYIEIPIQTHLGVLQEDLWAPDNRNAVNILTANVIVALPGNVGTANEVQLAYDYKRPAIAYIDDPADIPDLPADFPWSSDLQEVEAFVKQHLPQ